MVILEGGCYKLWTKKKSSTVKHQENGETHRVQDITELPMVHGDTFKGCLYKICEIISECEDNNEGWMFSLNQTFT